MNFDEVVNVFAFDRLVYNQQNIICLQLGIDYKFINCYIVNEFSWIRQIQIVLKKNMKSDLVITTTTLMVKNLLF